MSLTQIIKISKKIVWNIKAAGGEKRELILQRVKEFIVAHGGIVKKNQLEELHIDYRRILDFVEKVQSMIGVWL